MHEKLLPLPDETLVYPAHGAGSLCGKHLSTDTVSTIGIQRRYNYALQPMSREEFIAVVTADQPDSPAYFTYDAVLNAKERPTLDEALAEELTPLVARRRPRARSRGAQLLDARRAPTSPVRTSAAASTSASTGATRRGPGRCSTTSGRSSSSSTPGRERGGGGAARADRLRQRRRLSRRRHARASSAAGARRAHRADHGRDARRAARRSPSRRSCSTSAPRTSARRSPSTGSVNIPLSTAARAPRRAAARPRDRRPLLERVSLVDRGEHPPPRRLRRGSPTWSAGSAARCAVPSASISLSSVFQLRCVPRDAELRSK